MSIQNVEAILKNPSHISILGSKSFELRYSHRLLAASFVLAVGFLTSFATQAHDNHKDFAKASLSTKNISESPDSALKKPTIYFEDLGAFVSKNTENKEQFLTRVSHFIRQYTDQTGWEACGLIHENSNQKQWAVQVVTNASHIACKSLEMDNPDYAATTETIHSHPKPGGFNVTLQDQRMSGNLCGSWRNTQPFDFSSKDLQAESSYLIIPGKKFSSKPQLLYQKNGVIQVISKLDNTVSKPDVAKLSDWKVEAEINLNHISAAPTYVNPNLKSAKSCKPF